MIEDQFLPYFINEPIYLIGEQEAAEPEVTAQAPEEKAQEAAPVVPEAQAIAPSPKIPTATPDVTTPAPSAPEVHELAIWAPPLTTEDRELLVKILAAIKQDFSKAKLMEGIAAYEPHYKRLLCFGYLKELELKLGEPVAMYEPGKIAAREVLVSVAPEALHSDRNAKGRLWTALQKMFPV